MLESVLGNEMDGDTDEEQTILKKNKDNSDSLQILCKMRYLPTVRRRRVAATEKKGCPLHAQPGFPTRRREEMIRRRFETAPGARRTRSASAHQRRAGKK